MSTTTEERLSRATRRHALSTEAYSSTLDALIDAARAMEVER